MFFDESWHKNDTMLATSSGSANWPVGTAFWYLQSHIS